MLLEQEADIAIVGSVDTLVAARGLMEAEEPPDVLVLDIRLAEERGLDLLVPSSGPLTSRPAIVIWTGFDLPQYALFALRSGAAGFVAKSAPLGELLAAIRTAAGGGLHFATAVSAEPIVLSPKERRVLACVIAGLSNDEMATDLSVTSRTVEAHLTRLYQRFGVSSRTELAARALQEGWLDLPDEGGRARPGT